MQHKKQRYSIENQMAIEVRMKKFFDRDKIAKRNEREKRKLAESKPSAFIVCIGNRAFFNFGN